MISDDSMLKLFVMILVELELLGCLILCFKIIRDMRKDLEYSVTRIFLSQRSVRGIKGLVFSLIVYAFFNLLTVLGTSGTLLLILLKINLLILFGGLGYFFWQVSMVTGKKGEI